MHTQIKPPDELTKISLQKKKEEEKMHDILLLLENLTYREEASIKLIIDCLYDIGSINLIDQKFNSRTLKGSLKLISRLSKPAVIIIAWRWYTRNCPKLIASWLRKQVAFKPKTTIKQAVQVEAGLVPESKHLKTDSLVHLESQNREVEYLRSQVKTLSTIIVSLIVVFGSSIVWLGYSFERSNLQTVEQLENRIRVIESSTEKPLVTGKGN